MPARKLSDGTWIVDVWVDIPKQGRRRLRKRSPIQTKKGAERYEAELVENALCPSEPVEERRFEDFAVEFLQNHVRPRCKYSTLVTYESAMNEHLVPRFTGRGVASITKRDLAQLHAALAAEERSAKTVRNILGVLSSALHMAREWGYLEHVPAFRFPKLPPPRFRFLSVEECERLEAASTLYWRAMVNVARKTGLRLGELCALTWEQVKLDQAAILVDRAVWRGKVSLPKHDKVRTVDLSPATADLLRKLAHTTGGKGLVFPGRGGRMRLERKCDLGLRRCAARAGLEPFGWHVMRHTYASHLVMAGVPLPVVQQLMGHADIRLTMRYAHLAPGQTTCAVAKLDGLGQHLGSGAREERREQPN